MEKKEKKILYLRFGLTLKKIIEEKKGIAKENKTKGTKDHKLISSLRKLAAASGIDYGTVQKISKGDQGLEFFTFIDLLDALDMDMIEFGEKFKSPTDQEIRDYQTSIQKTRKENGAGKTRKKK